MRELGRGREQRPAAEGSGQKSGLAIEDKQRPGELDWRFEKRQPLHKRNGSECRGHKPHCPTLRFIENVKLPLKMAPGDTVSSEERQVSVKEGSKGNLDEDLRSRVIGKS